MDPSGHAAITTAAVTGVTLFFEFGMSLMVTYEAYKQIKNGIYGGRHITGTKYHYTYRTVIIPDTVKPATPAKSASTLSKKHRKRKLKKKLEARLGKGKILQATRKKPDADGYREKSRDRTKNKMWQKKNTPRDNKKQNKEARDALKIAANGRKIIKEIEEKYHHRITGN